MRMLWDDLQNIFQTEEKLTPEDARRLEIAEAISRENWTKVRQIGQRDNLNSGQLFELIADGACHVYAAHREPKRAKEWTAIYNTLELLQYEDLADAIDMRNELTETGAYVKR